MRQACADPTPSDSAWWHETTSAPDAHGMSIVSFAEPPQLPQGLDARSWAGDYRLTMVPTVGPARNHVYTAHVVLLARAPTDSVSALTGTATPDQPWPTPHSFAPGYEAPNSVVSADVLYQSTARSLSVVIGNPGLRWTDAGVILDVFAVSKDGFAGRWADGGLIVFRDSVHKSGVHPQGYFCLTRMAPM